MFDLEKSPIRKNINELDEDKLSIFENEEVDGSKLNLNVREILKDVERMLQVQDENKEGKTKIAVMGEIKAGKSTFINAVVEQEVAYTDIFEATAIVSEITYSEEEYARVLDENGNVLLECDFEELLEWTEDKLLNEESFSECSKIEIGVDNDLLENIIIVDTPGLLSITSENHNVTNDYIAETDYILWVLDSNNLGSKDVREFISKVKLSGKPLIGVVNKVDNEEIKEEISEFIDENFSDVFEEIFFLSASKAWKGIKADDEDLKEGSGICEIIDCIETLSVGKDESVNSTENAQLKREREVHLRFMENVKTRKGSYDDQIIRIKNINREMKETIKEELNYWMAYEFYVDEIKTLNSVDGKEFEDLYKLYKSEAFVNGVIENKLKEISAYILDSWKEVGHVLINRPDKKEPEFKNYKNIINDDEPIIANSTNKTMADRIREGAKTGGMATVGLAGYSAVLGPAAAAVTFAGALPAVIPIGIAVGAFKFFNTKGTDDSQEAAKNKNDVVNNLRTEVRNYVKENSEEIMKIPYSETDAYFRFFYSKCNEIVKQVNFDFTEPNYNIFICKLEGYIKDLDSEISKFDNQTIAKPEEI